MLAKFVYLQHHLLWSSSSPLKGSVSMMGLACKTRDETGLMRVCFEGEKRVWLETKPLID